MDTRSACVAHQLITTASATVEEAAVEVDTDGHLQIASVDEESAVGAAPVVDGEACRVVLIEQRNVRDSVLHVAVEGPKGGQVVEVYNR